MAAKQTARLLPSLQWLSAARYSKYGCRIRMRCRS